MFVQYDFFFFFCIFLELNRTRNRIEQNEPDKAVHMHWENRLLYKKLAVLKRFLIKLP